MKLYAFVIALTLVMLSLRAFAAPVAQVNPCVDVAMAMASEAANGQATNPIFSHSIEVEKDISDYVYAVDVVGGQNGDVQNVAATVRVFFRKGVAYCG